MKLNNLRTGLTFDDVLLVPQKSTVRSRHDVSLETTFSRNIELAIPISAANMDTVCESEMAVAMARLGGIGVIHRFMTMTAQANQIRLVKDQGDLLVGAAIGTDHDMLDRSRELVDSGANALVLDIAHGHADHAIQAVVELKKMFSSIDVIAGNVATRKGAEDLVRAGADAIKVGVGPGGVCTTRLVAGVGVPQLTAIDDITGIDVPIIADGGIRTSGDIAKALAIGANSVMIGSLLAGTKESPGEIEQGPTGLRKRIRGMASFEAVEARAERQGEDLDEQFFEQRAAEGVEGTVPYRGEVSKLIWNLLAGLRSSMSYSDSTTLKEFAKKSEFIRVTPLGFPENTPHATTRTT